MEAQFSVFLAPYALSLCGFRTMKVRTATRSGERLSDDFTVFELQPQ